MTWLLFAFLSGLFSNIALICMRLALKNENDSTPMAWLIEATRTLIFGTWVLLHGGLYYPPQTWLVLIGLGLSEVIGIYAYAKMHAISELSVSTLISRSRLIWIAIFGFVFLGESLSMYEYLGIGIIFFGISLVSSPRRIFVDAGAAYAHIFALSAAGAAIGVKILSNTASMQAIMLFLSLPSTLFIPLLMRGSSRKRLRKFFLTNIHYKVLASLFTILSPTFLILAAKTGVISKASAIQQGMMIIPVIIGIVALKERTHVRGKILGVVATIFGTILMLDPGLLGL